MPLYSFEDSKGNRHEVMADNPDQATSLAATALGCPAEELARVYTQPAGVVFVNNARDGQRGTSRKSTWRKTE